MADFIGIIFAISAFILFIISRVLFDCLKKWYENKYVYINQAFYTGMNVSVMDNLGQRTNEIPYVGAWKYYLKWSYILDDHFHIFIFTKNISVFHASTIQYIRNCNYSVDQIITDGTSQAIMEYIDENDYDVYEIKVPGRDSIIYHYILRTYTKTKSARKTSHLWG
jgi:hypothetical protein